MTTQGASGDDTAAVLYYTNINYNATNVPITSFKNNQLESRFLQNQTNYQVAINKMKISSLDGVILSYMPFEEFELGLKITDPSGTPHYANGWVALPNDAGIIEYFEYFSFINQNTNLVELYKNSKLDSILSFSFTPLDADDGNTVYPLWAFYDIVNNRYWAVDYTYIYLYDSNGLFIASKPLTSIAYASLENTTGNLLICESYTFATTNELTIWNYSSGNITSIGAIRNTHAGVPFTFIQTAASDGVTIIISYLNNQITTASATTYATIADSTLTYVNQIQNILIDTVNNDFIIVDNRYIPNLCANTDDGIGAINLKSLFTATPEQILETSQGYYSMTNQAGYAFVSNNTGTIDPEFAVVNWTAITPSTTYATYSSGNKPYFITNYEVGTTVNIGICDIGGGVYRIVTADNTNNWQIVGTFPQTPGLFTVPPKMFIDQITGTTYICGSGLDSTILRSETPPVLADGLPIYTTVNFVSINVYLNNEPPASEIMYACDPAYRNIIYAVYNQILYIGSYNPTANSIFMRQWDWSPTDNYFRYIMIPYGVFIETPSTFGGFQYRISKYVLSTFTLNPNPAVITYADSAVQLFNISKSTRDNRLYVSITGQINKYSLTDFSYITTEGNIIIPGLGSTSTITSTEIIPPSKAERAVYDMNDYIVAFNTCLASLYAQIKAIAPTIQILTPPYYTLDYTSKFLTLNYDPNYSAIGNGIYINANLLVYAKFPTIPGDGLLSGLNKYVLSPSGSITQTQTTFYLLNTVDKIIVKTNMSMLTDYTGASNQQTTFTDLDLDTTLPGFFNMDGSFLYSAILLRNYDLVSNQSLRNISYQIYIQYLDGEELEYKIPPGQNISLKLQFSRVY